MSLSIVQARDLVLGQANACWKLGMFSSSISFILIVRILLALKTEQPDSNILQHSLTRWECVSQKLAASCSRLLGTSLVRDRLLQSWALPCSPPCKELLLASRSIQGMLDLMSLPAEFLGWLGGIWLDKPLGNQVHKLLLPLPCFRYDDHALYMRKQSNHNLVQSVRVRVTYGETGQKDFWIILRSQGSML